MRRGRVVLTSESSNTRGGSRDGGRGGNQRGGQRGGGNRGGGNRRQEAERSTDPFEEKMISLERNAKTYQGGRRFKFQAVVVVGDRNGRVGLGIGKSREVPLAVAKANANARKNLIRVPLQNGTIPHDIIGVNTTSNVILRPASAGTGVIAGGVPRAIAELAGITDLLSKELGSRTKVNVAYAVFDGLRRLQTREGLAKLKEFAQ
jgi:small subunit ribosomal protein S5